MAYTYTIEAYDKKGEHLEQFSKMISGMGSFQAQNHCQIEGVSAFKMTCPEIIPRDTYKIALYVNGEFNMYLSVSPEKFKEYVESLRMT